MKENVRMQANAMKELNDISMKDAIVVFGSTYMSKFPLYELINKYMFENAVYNRSIEGLTVGDALEIVKDCVISISPVKIFLSLGEEDESNPDAIEKYSLLVSLLRSRLPHSTVYIIGLTGDGKYAQEFNKSLLALCDDKNVKYIDFISKQASEMTLYKARFKQLSCFFRNKPLSFNDAFIIAEV